MDVGSHLTPRQTDSKLIPCLTRLVLALDGVLELPRELLVPIYRRDEGALLLPLLDEGGLDGGEPPLHRSELFARALNLPHALATQLPRTRELGVRVGGAAARGAYVCGELAELLADGGYTGGGGRTLGEDSALGLMKLGGRGVLIGES